MSILRYLLPPQFHYFARVLRKKEPPWQRQRFWRDFIAWSVPLPVQSLALSIGYRRKGVDVRRNAALRNRHRGRRCFVMGNGPSLGELDLRPLAGEITVGANSFYKHRDAEAVGLKYLCVGDASFMTDEPKSVEWHRVIEEKMPEATLMLHPDARELIGKHALYQKHSVHFFHPGIPTNVPELVDFDFEKPINVGLNTGTRLCIPLALFMGCTDIILLGFDANWLDSLSSSYHFYAKHEQFPEFDSVLADSRVLPYEGELLGTLRDFEAHRLLNTRAQQLGARIRNASPGGRLDVYPRIDFEKCF